MTEQHRHDWMDEPNLKDGPVHCRCGKSKWVHAGKTVRPIPTRFPMAEPMERIVILKAKLDSGRVLSQSDQEELNLIAEALIEAFKPLSEAFVKLADQVSVFIQGFLDRIDPKVIRQMGELAKAYGEKPDTWDHSIDIQPVSAVVKGKLVEPDSIQMGVISREQFYLHYPHARIKSGTATNEVRESMDGGTY